MSRADPVAALRGGVAGGGLRHALRSAAFDFYYQSIRLVPANVLWGLAFLGALAVGLGGGPLATLAVMPVLAIPYVGVMCLAVQVARGEDVVLSDVWRAYRRFGVTAVAIGAGLSFLGAILASNVVIGATTGGFLGWAFGTLAGSGLLAVWVMAFPIWVIVVDPARTSRPVRERLRLAVLLVLAAPGRCALLAFVLAVLLLVSTVAFAALLTISVSFTCLVAARYLLPLSDRLEDWLDSRRGSTEGRVATSHHPEQID